MATLTWEQVHAWRVGRHYLQPPAPRAGLLDVVRRIGGLHAQVMSAAGLAAWARLSAAQPDDVPTALWTRRTLVKTWAMRGTLHLMAVSDYPLYVAALGGRHHFRRASWLKYYGLTLAEMEAVQAAIPAVLDGHCLTREELSAAVAERTGLPHMREQLLSGWGTMLKPAAFRGDLCFGPSQGQQVTFVRPDQWLGPQPAVEDHEAALLEMVRRYLGTYGPATHEDFARWWGLERGKARPLFRALADELVEVTVEDEKVWALAGTVEAMAAATDSTVRLLPHFDPLIVVGHPQRRYQMPIAVKDRVYRQAGWVTPVVLVGGRMVGTWDSKKGRAAAEITARPFDRFTPAVQEGIAAEAERLGVFLGTPVTVRYDAA